MSAVREAILDHFRNGGTLTKITAIGPPFSTTNLGDKCYILRKQGWPIKKRWKTTSDGKRRYAEYYLERKEQ